MSETTNAPTAEMPRYRCHKEVHALRIRRVEIRPEVVLLHPVEAGYAPVQVTPDYFARHQVLAGGYYVVYEDGYASFSPAKAFTEGYTLIAGEPQTVSDADVGSASALLDLGSEKPLGACEPKGNGDTCESCQ